MNDASTKALTLPSVRSATDQVFTALYDAVVSLKLPPGTKVSEAEVAQRFEVSRQPVRDAFFRLSKLGFLKIQPQRATVVTLISKRAVVDALFTRTALEVECLRTAMRRMSDTDVGILRQSLVRQSASLDGSDPTNFHALDESFHETICIIAGHTHIWQLIREQKAHMDRIRFLTLSEQRQHQVLGEHQAIFDAILAQDAEAAETRLRAHLRDLSTVLAQAETSHPHYFDEGA